MARQITEHSKKQLELTLLSVSDYTHSPLYIATHINHKHTHTHTHTHTHNIGVCGIIVFCSTRNTHKQTHTHYITVFAKHTHTHTHAHRAHFSATPPGRRCAMCAGWSRSVPPSTPNPRGSLVRRSSSTYTTRRLSCAEEARELW